MRFICTFTSYSVKFKEDIFNFFLNNDLVLKLHPALPSLRDKEPEKWALDPEEFGDLLIYLLDKYLENLNEIEIMNINDLCKCLFTNRGTICTFVDCMGDTFAVGPDGSIYPCYRFVGMPEYVMGNVYNHPSRETLANSDAWKVMHQFKEYVNQQCSGCTHIRYCRGGCPYNAIVHNNGELRGVDPYCVAYKKIFDEIIERFNRELLGSSMIEIATSPSEHTKYAKPGIMSLMQKLASN